MRVDPHLLPPPPPITTTTTTSTTRPIRTTAAPTRTLATTTISTATTTISTATINNRLIRHTYEEVDIDWPLGGADLALPTHVGGAEEAGREPVADGDDDDSEDTVSRHSYERVDFEHGISALRGGDGHHGNADLAVSERMDIAANSGPRGGQAPARINLSHTIRRLRMCGWYWGDITSEQAKEVLRRAQNGSFILRDSSDACHLFTLSLKANNLIVSVRVAFSRGLFKLDSWNQEDSPSFQSVVDMIEYYLEDESHEFYVELPHIGEFPVCLKHPIWKKVPGLQHLCRTTVVKYCRTSDKLRSLPLPPHLIRYVLEFSPEDNVSNNSESNSVNSDDVESNSPPTMCKNVYPIEPTA